MESSAEGLETWKGKAVELFGLKGSANLNGRVGHVRGTAEGSAGRLNVFLQASGPRIDQRAREVSIRPSNLKKIVEGGNRNYAAQLAAGGGLFASQRTRLVQRSIATLGDANREFMDSGRDGGMTINILKNDHLSSLSSCSSSFIINHHE